MTIKHNSIGIADLGVVHNCQKCLNSTENTNYYTPPPPLPLPNLVH